MLNRLFIKNFALIAEVELTFSQGMTVLTGETGAGKSMLTDALELALGAKTDGQKIRPGADEAIVEASFDIEPNSPAADLLKTFDIPLDEGEVILRRIVPREGKSRATANGMRLPLPQLQELASALLERHSQHESQKLFRSSQHALLLDHFGGHTKQAADVRANFKVWQTAQTELDAMRERLKNQSQEHDLLTAYVTELEELDYTPGEEESLAQERKQLMGAENIQHALTVADDALTAEQGCIATLAIAERALNDIRAVDGALSSLSEQLTSHYAELSDLAREISRLSSAYTPNPERLQEVDDRLAALKDVARKHHSDMASLPAVLVELSEKLAGLANLADDFTAQEAAVEKAHEAFITAAKKLSAARQKTAASMAPAVENALAELHMDKTKFEVQLNNLPDADWNRNGAEEVSFYIQANPGLPAAPLIEAASGGEVSRLMLALKQVLYQNLPAQTLIFDEIDSGIGGAVAAAAGAALAAVAKRHQVLVITHQPQVAAQGTAHLKISKSAAEGVTTTAVARLTASEREAEIARMLAGKEVTAEARQAAQSLLKGAA